MIFTDVYWILIGSDESNEDLATCRDFFQFESGSPASSSKEKQPLLQVDKDLRWFLKRISVIIAITYIFVHRLQLRFLALAIFLT